MSRDRSDRPDDPGTQAVPVSTEAAMEPIDGILAPAIVTVPLAGALELGSDGQFHYRPRKIHGPAAGVFEYTSME